MYLNFSGVIGHNGYSSCLKCTTEGEYNYEYHVMIFPELNATLRTDAEFRAGIYENHHKERTVLEKIINLDIVKDFPIGDALHLIDLGITKRFLQGWKLGNMNNYNAKWSTRDIENISTFLKQCKMPREIHRSVRGLHDLAHWKGTEYRTFLLYLSIIVLDKFFKCKAIFEHFLNFYCAIMICSRNDLCEKNCDIARFLIRDFLEGVKLLYGKHLFTSNMHNLSHLIDDVERYGPLHTFSAYPFESKLYWLKRLIRSGNLPLNQVINRISEMQSNITLSNISEKNVPRLLKNLVTNDEELNFLSEYYQIFSVLELNDFSIRISSDADKWIMTKSWEIVSVKYILQMETNKRILFYGCALKTLEDYFVKPIKSSSLQIYMSNLELCEFKCFELENLYCKMVQINCKEDSPKSIFIPLIHTIV